MVDQAVYTSSESGIIPGKSGYCFVAATSGVDGFILSKLEKISEFSHEQSKKYLYERIYSLQKIELAGSILYVLTRSTNSGFDFSGRTNHISHHLIFKEQELCLVKNPCDVFKGWAGWLDNWKNGINELVEFNPHHVTVIPDFALVPCKAWTTIAGESLAALTPIYKFRETPIVIDQLRPDEVLALIHESLEVKSIQNSIYNESCSLWDTTFTTSGLSEESNTQFLWCFKYGKLNDNNSLSRLYGKLKSTFSDVDKIVASYLTSPPKVNYNLERSQLGKSETIFITSTIESGFPPPEIAWYLNANRSQWNLVGTGDKVSLIIEEEGEFQIYCTSKNLRGQNQSEVTTVQITFHQENHANSNPDSDFQGNDIENQSTADEPTFQALKYQDIGNWKVMSESNKNLLLIILLAVLLIGLFLVYFGGDKIQGFMSKFFNDIKYQGLSK